MSNHHLPFFVFKKKPLDHKTADAHTLIVTDTAPVYVSTERWLLTPRSKRKFPSRAGAARELGPAGTIPVPSSLANARAGWRRARRTGAGSKAPPRSMGVHRTTSMSKEPVLQRAVVLNSTCTSVFR